MTLEISGQIRVLLVGYGFAGAWIHAPLINASPMMRVTGVVTRNADRASLARKRHKDVSIYPDADSAYAQDDFDVVVIATPNHRHEPDVLQALDGNVRGIVLDKPIAPTLGSAQKIVEAVETTDVSLSVFHNRRWDGDFLTVRRVIEKNLLGTIHRFTSRFDRWDTGPTGWRGGSRSQGGGVLLDLGPHLIDQALWLFGSATQIYAELDSRTDFRKTDDDVFLALTHQSGVRSHLYASMWQASHDLRFHVSGAAGSFIKTGKDIQEEQLLAGDLVTSKGFGVEPRERWGYVQQSIDSRDIETIPGAWENFYDDFCNYLCGEAPNPVPLLDALETMRIIDAAEESAESQKIINLERK